MLPTPRGMWGESGPTFILPPPPSSAASPLETLTTACPVPCTMLHVCTLSLSSYLTPAVGGCVPPPRILIRRRAAREEPLHALGACCERHGRRSAESVRASRRIRTPSVDKHRGRIILCHQAECCGATERPWQCHRQPDAGRGREGAQICEGQTRCPLPERHAFPIPIVPATYGTSRGLLATAAFTSVRTSVAVEWPSLAASSPRTSPAATFTTAAAAAVASVVATLAAFAACTAVAACTAATAIAPRRCRCRTRLR